MFLRFLLLSTLAAALSAQNVKVNWDRSTFFSNFKTFKWMPPSTDDKTNPQIVDTIVAQTNVQLEAKGVKSTNGQPDLLVAYITSVDKPLVPPSTGPSSPYQPGPSWNGKQGETHPVGTLVIDLYDAKTKLMVWRAIITAQVGESRPSDKVKIAKGISKAFAQYPPMGK